MPDEPANTTPPAGEVAGITAVQPKLTISLDPHPPDLVPSLPNFREHLPITPYLAVRSNDPVIRHVDEIVVHANVLPRLSGPQEEDRGQLTPLRLLRVWRGVEDTATGQTRWEGEKGYHVDTANAAPGAPWSDVPGLRIQSPVTRPERWVHEFVLTAQDPAREPDAPPRPLPGASQVRFFVTFDLRPDRYRVRVSAPLNGQSTVDDPTVSWVQRSGWRSFTEDGIDWMAKLRSKP